MGWGDVTGGVLLGIAGLAWLAKTLKLVPWLLCLVAGQPVTTILEAMAARAVSDDPAERERGLGDVLSGLASRWSATATRLPTSTSSSARAAAPPRSRSPTR